MEHFGLGYEDLAPLNPALIYCSITGFGETGPYADRGGYDVIASGVAGLMHLTGPKVQWCVRVLPWCRNTCMMEWGGPVGVFNITSCTLCTRFGAGGRGGRSTPGPLVYVYMHYNYDIQFGRMELQWRWDYLWLTSQLPFMHMEQWWLPYWTGTELGMVRSCSATSFKPRCIVVRCAFDCTVCC